MIHTLERSAAGLLAVLYLFGGAEHWLGVDPCPHHDAAFYEAGIVDAGDSGHHEHHGGTSEPSESEDHGPCMCVGPCATPPPVALPSTTSHAIAVALERVESQPAPSRDAAPLQFLPYLLPYAHAPPSLG